jgi:hypothetical protein
MASDSDRLTLQRRVHEPLAQRRLRADGFPGVRAVFEENLASCADVGASFCATVEGETVVDLWGGFADEARTRPWRDDTIVRAVAEILAILANGGVAGGRRFLSEAGCRRALDPQVDGVDLILGVPMRFGLGFALDTGLMPNPNTLYWGGYGGSLAIIDMDARTTLAYAMNRMSGTTTGDFRALGPAMAFWEASTA